MPLYTIKIELRAMYKRLTEKEIVHDELDEKTVWQLPKSKKHFIHPVLLFNEVMMVLHYASGLNSAKFENDSHSAKMLFEFGDSDPHNMLLYLGTICKAHAPDKANADPCTMDWKDFCKTFHVAMKVEVTDNGRRETFMHFYSPNGKSIDAKGLSSPVAFDKFIIDSI